MHVQPDNIIVQQEAHHAQLVQQDIVVQVQVIEFNVLLEHIVQRELVHVQTAQQVNIIVQPEVHHVQLVQQDIVVQVQVIEFNVL